jgi:transposase
MVKADITVILSENQRRVLRRWVRAKTSPQRLVMRARIVLMADSGNSLSEIQQEVGVSRPTVTLWKRRFQTGGPEALLHDAAGRGRKRSIPDAKVAQILTATVETQPQGATHWSTRAMAKAQGVSHSTIQRLWSGHGLQPHRTETFKLSTDPRFVEKMSDVVGLYLNPPDKALVLCIDEKSQIQALDRSQPSLPMKPGRCETMTHDYKRHGTTTLFAALSLLDGTVIGSCYPRHRHKEFLKFLAILDRDTPRELDLHVILDNYGTHKHPKVKQWLTEHPRFYLHFTPTSCSWMNLIERWFGHLTEKRIRRGTFRNLPELIYAIHEFIDLTNEDPKQFVWTATTNKILEKLKRCKAISETVH